MSEAKIHISRAICDEDTHEVAYVVDGLMFADVATQRKLNAVDDMYEALELAYKNCLGRYGSSKDSNECVLYVNKECMIARALRKARGERE